MKLKRFLVFANGNPQHGEAAGGWGDFAGHFDTHKEAEACEAFYETKYGYHAVIVDIDDADVTHTIFSADEYKPAK